MLTHLVQSILVFIFFNCFAHGMEHDTADTSSSNFALDLENEFSAKIARIKQAVLVDFIRKIKVPKGHERVIDDAFYQMDEIFLSVTMRALRSDWATEELATQIYQMHAIGAVTYIKRTLSQRNLVKPFSFTKQFPYYFAVGREINPANHQQVVDFINRNPDRILGFIFKLYEHVEPPYLYLKNFLDSEENIDFNSFDKKISETFRRKENYNYYLNNFLISYSQSIKQCDFRAENPLKRKSSDEVGPQAQAVNSPISTNRSVTESIPKRPRVESFPSNSNKIQISSCHICERAWLSQSEFVAHLEGHRGHFNKRYICYRCGLPRVSFDNPEQFIRHIALPLRNNRHEEEEEEPSHQQLD